MSKSDSRKPTAEIYSERFRLMRRTAAYYAVLNDEAENFRNELRELYRGLVVEDWRDPTAVELDQLKVFAKKWRLPRQCAIEDLWNSIFEEIDLLAPTEQIPPTIVIGSDTPEPTRRWAPDELPRLSVDPLARVGGEGDPNTCIRPWEPPEIYYTPYFMSQRWVRKEADRIALRVRDSIVAQAEELENRARERGWKPIPPWHQDPTALRRIALRLYRGAVLEWPWSKLGDTECVAIRTVRDSVNEWAKALDIPLPG